MRQTNGTEITDRIDYVRKQKHIMLNDLAAAVGINTSTLRVWRLRGTVPQADVLWNMAEYLHVEPEWLLFGEQTKITTDSNELVTLLNGCKPEMLDAVKGMLIASQK